MCKGDASKDCNEILKKDNIGTDIFTHINSQSNQTLDYGATFTHSVKSFPGTLLPKRGKHQQPYDTIETVCEIRLISL